MIFQTRLFGILILMGLLITSCGSHNDLSIIPTANPAAVVSEFRSDAEFRDGCYWLRDDAPGIALWKLTSIQPGTDISIKLTVFSTDEYQTPGLPASFFLSFGIEEGEKMFELDRRSVYLINTSPESYPEGFSCSGTLTIDAALIPAGVKSLWIMVSPIESDEMGDTRRVGLNLKSLLVVPNPQKLDLLKP